jgi:hypothetical protein
VSVHVLFQILFTKLKDENELDFGVDDIMEADDVDVLELLHEGDLSDGGRGRAFLCVKIYFLEGDNFICGPGSALDEMRGTVSMEEEQLVTL